MTDTTQQPVAPFSLPSDDQQPVIPPVAEPPVSDMPAVPAVPPVGATSGQSQSYVNDYMPPRQPVSTGEDVQTIPFATPESIARQEAQAAAATQTTPVTQTIAEPPVTDNVPAMTVQNMPAWQPPAEPAALPTPPDEMLLNSTVTPAATSDAAQTPAQSPAQTQSQSLEDQNIFHLLGIDNAKEEDKESFLDELQEVIWQSFLEDDLYLLITEEEMVEFKKVQNKVGVKEDERQAEMIEFLEKLIPDLEKIMLEKALELKEEIVRKRIEEMAKEFATQPDKLAKVEEAKKLANDNQWLDVANLLNSLKMNA